METEKVYAICKNISPAGGKGSPQGADTGIAYSTRSIR